MRPHHHLTIGISAAAIAAAQNFTFPSFDWDSISPTTHLEYHDCYTSFQCARLQLPLDWKNSSDPRLVAIAIIKLPAKVPDHDPTFGGSVFTNPGGPGGSGVDLVLASGRQLQDYIDTPGKKHFEVVSFDPRGIKNSRPVADCFPVGGVLARDAMRLEKRGFGSLTGDPGRLAYGLAMQDGFGRRCAVADEQGLNGGEIFSYLGTPNVARDMVEMVDKIDELRRERDDEDEDEDKKRGELKKRRDGNEDVARLQYIGFSYGTILGNYFSSLFPERVGRVVLDGVCNADDYSNGGGWLTNVVDTDEIINTLFTGCFQAGPTICALARPSDKSPSDISTRFWSWLQKLDKTPIAGLSSSGNAIVLSGADIRLLLGTSAYKPAAAWIPLAQLLNNAMQGENLASLLSSIEMSILGGPLQEACPIANFTSSDRGSDAQHGILCGDGEDVTSKNLTWWQSYLEKQTAASSVFGAYWTTIRFPCSRWRFRANWIFKGPYTTPSATRWGQKPEKGRPAAPLLFLSNRLDPVTPLRAARAMAGRHPGAGVVVQEAMGHCAFAAAYSECTRRIVAEYFDSGRVPDGEVSCETECGPWDGECRAGVMGRGEPWYARRFPLGI